MGVLSVLGKIGGLVAAPFTGGLSLIPTIASAAGDVAGSIAKGRQERRDVEGRQQFGVDASRNAQTLDAEQARVLAERARMRQMIAADLLGTRGQGRINPETLAMLKDRSTQAFTSGSDISMPTFQDLPKAGKLDSFLNILGGVGAGAKVLDRLPQRPGIDMAGPGLGGRTTGAPQLPYYQPPKADPWLLARRTVPPTGKVI